MSEENYAWTLYDFRYSKDASSLSWKDYNSTVIYKGREIERKKSIVTYIIAFRYNLQSQSRYMSKQYTALSRVLDTFDYSSRSNLS